MKKLKKIVGQLILFALDTLEKTKVKKMQFLVYN